MTITHDRPRARPLWVRHGAYRRLLLGASTSAAGTGVAASRCPSSQSACSPPHPG